ncbi:MAG: hypothetical protein J6S71_02800 [Clostridia bacterium]|nr:hypothetical protein [Clostridia bacterium]
MADKLRKELEAVNEALLLSELYDHTDRREFAELKKRKRLLVKAIRRIERFEKRYALR